MDNWLLWIYMDNWLIHVHVFLCLQDSHCHTLITPGSGDSWYLAKQTDLAKGEDFSFK